MKLEIGKTYLIKHSRKGTFTARIMREHDGFTTAVIVDGKTTAILDCNVDGVGDTVSFRTKFIVSAKEQGK